MFVQKKMGSTGSGSFTDYSEYKGNEKQGGDDSENRCMKAFSTSLEEVGRSAYVTARKSVPPADSSIIIVLNDRLEVILESTNESIGYLPTKYNYLANCIAKGYSYTGIVTNSSSNPIHSIIVDIEPHEP